MARRICAGNWKMYGLRADLAEIRAIAVGLGDMGLRHAGTPKVLICPPATLIAQAVEAAHGHLGIGAQDCHAAPSGAHTGDIAPAMLVDAGATHVILGHSERRRDCGEGDADIAAKITAAQAAGLTTIVCVGETLAHHTAGTAHAVVAAQLAASLPRGVQPAALVIAYEPVWAIGTGLTPKPHEINDMHGHIRAKLLDECGPMGVDVPILYGGSVTPDTARAIFAVPGVDGALVGGASLQAASFLAVVRALSEAAH